MDATSAAIDPGSVISARRALSAAAIGILVGAAIVFAGEPALAPIGGWTVAAGFVLIWAWRITWPQDPEGTERLAEQEGRSHTTDTAVLVAAGMSLLAVVLALIRSGRQDDVTAGLTVVLAVVSIALSWALVNTVFALKYARLYYIDEDGGLDFRDEAPAYCDFAYVAFTVGMTCAVAETEPTNSAMRKAITGHALLSFLFGTGILAVAVNLVTHLGQ
jgi:uncharacterized membrane protein